MINSFFHLNAAGFLLAAFIIIQKSPTIAGLFVL